MGSQPVWRILGGVSTNNPIRVGLTGGIGSGKSTVAGLLRNQGIPVIDADAISRSVTAVGGVALPAIRERFGPNSIDASGAMDRAYMRERVFQDPNERQALEAIVHPWVRQTIHEQAQACTAPWIVLDLPLLCESPHWREQVRWVWVVDCFENTQIQRVMSRSGWSREEVLAVMEQQCSRADRLAMADAVIHNEGIDLTELAQAVRTVVAQFGL
jgi:dephospho-CoA kinase